MLGLGYSIWLCALRCIRSSGGGLGDDDRITYEGDARVTFDDEQRTTVP